MGRGGRGLSAVRGRWGSTYPGPTRTSLWCGRCSTQPWPSAASSISSGSSPPSIPPALPSFPCCTPVIRARLFLPPCFCLERLGRQSDKCARQRDGVDDTDRDDSSLCDADVVALHGTLTADRGEAQIIAEHLQDDASAEERAAAMKQLDAADGILVPGGFGDRGVLGKMNACKYAREKKKPFLGVCLGMQVQCRPLPPSLPSSSPPPSLPFSTFLAVRISPSSPPCSFDFHPATSPSLPLPWAAFSARDSCGV